MSGVALSAFTLATILASIGTLTDARASVVPFAHVPSDSGDANGVWMPLGPRVPGLPITFAATVYDPVRQRMLVQGAYLFAACGDSGCAYSVNPLTWAMSLGDTPAWTQLIPGASPSGRQGEALIYDPVRDRLVLFGGYEPFVDRWRNDVWALPLSQGDTASWVEITPPGTLPSERVGASGIYDPVRERLVIFGGNQGATLFDDTWALPLASPDSEWVQLETVGSLPSPRTGHAGIYDPVRDRMLIFGAFFADSVATYQETWSLPLAAPGGFHWSKIEPTGSLPPWNEGPAAIYDPVRDRLVVLDGTQDSRTWGLPLAGVPSWMEILPAGSAPSPRVHPSTIYDPVADRLILFGGLNVCICDSQAVALTWGQTTAIDASPPAVAVTSSSVRLVWPLRGDASGRHRVYRRTSGPRWTVVGEAVADADHRVAYLDTAVERGGTYHYAVGLHAGDPDVLAGEVTVTIPSGGLSVVASRMPATRGRAAVRVTLETADPACLELFAPQGRLVEAVRLDAPAAGEREVSIGRGRRLPTGVYIVRVSQAARSASARLLVIR